MRGGSDLLRVVIELDRGEGPVSGRFLAEGQHEPHPFSGWLELLALLETARPPAARAAECHKEEKR